MMAIDFLNLERGGITVGGLKYGVHADVENHAVFANMQRPNFVSNIIRGVGKLFVKTEQDVALQEFEARLNQPRL